MDNKKLKDILKDILERRKQEEEREKEIKKQLELEKELSIMALGKDTNKFLDVVERNAESQSLAKDIGETLGIENVKGVNIQLPWVKKLAEKHGMTVDDFAWVVSKSYQLRDIIEKNKGFKTKSAIAVYHEIMTKLGVSPETFERVQNVLNSSPELKEKFRGTFLNPDIDAFSDDINFKITGKNLGEELHKDLDMALEVTPEVFNEASAKKLIPNMPHAQAERIIKASGVYDSQKQNIRNPRLVDNKTDGSLPPAIEDMLDEYDVSIQRNMRHDSYSDKKITPTSDNIENIQHYNASKIKSVNDETKRPKKSVDEHWVYHSDIHMNKNHFGRNDILMIEKYEPFTLLLKSSYGLRLYSMIYKNHSYETKLVKEIIENEKFKNLKIEKNLINLLLHTDNNFFKRELFYPAFFIDADFTFDERFIVKGIMVFECHTVKKVDTQERKGVFLSFGQKAPNDTRMHFTLVDKKRNDITGFGISFDDVKHGGVAYTEKYSLADYKDEKYVLARVVDGVVRIVCNLIDMVERNHDELSMRLVVPTKKQREKRIQDKEKARAPITTTVIIKPTKELLAYANAFEREHRQVKYSHRFVVRGHFRHFQSDFYKVMQGQKTWVRPYIKGHGILIKKDALVTTPE